MTTFNKRAALNNLLSLVFDNRVDGAAWLVRAG